MPYPANQDETKFSIQYTLACALLNGTYGAADMLKAEQMPENIRDLIAKIRLIPDEAMENREKGIRGTKVRVTLNNGKTEEETILVPKGDPEKPLTFADIVDKLKVCSADHANDAQVQNIIDYAEAFGGNKIFHYPKLS